MQTHHQNHKDNTPISYVNESTQEHTHHSKDPNVYKHAGIHMATLHCNSTATQWEDTSLKDFASALTMLLRRSRNLLLL